MDNLFVDAANGTFLDAVFSAKDDETNAELSVNGSDDKVHLGRTEAVELRDWLSDFLEETKPQLPAEDFSVIDALVDDDEQVRLVFLSGTWFDTYQNSYEPYEIVSFTVPHAG